MRTERFLSSFIEKLKGVDWTKNIIYMLIYFVLIFVFFGLVLYPMLQDTKAKNINYRKAEIAFNAVTDEYESKKSALAQYEKTNEKSIMGYAQKVSTDEIKKIASPYIKNLQIEKLKEGERKYPSEIYTLKGELASPTDFYKLDKVFDASGYVVSVNFPIEFRSMDKYIEISFEIEVFKTKAP